MTIRYLLDTDTASYIIKQHTPAVQRRLDAVGFDSVAISAISRAELLYGLERLEPDHRLQTLVRLFLKAVPTLPWDAAAADQYAGIRHRLTISGQPIGALDVMIAAHAVATGTMLVTNNRRHYSRVRPKLHMENWMESV